MKRFTGIENRTTKSPVRYKIISKEFAEQMVKYMKNNRSLTLKEKCQKIGVSVQTYYKVCRKYGLDAKIGPKMPNFNEREALQIMAVHDEDSSTSECIPSWDDPQ